MERASALSGNEMEGFTPVRRRVSTINTRQFQEDSEKDWTAARCNRLLRALQSRVSILNKDLLRFGQSAQARDSSTSTGMKAGTVRKADSDTEWNQARKKVKRTYSTRGGKSNNCARGSLRSRRMQASSEARPYIPGEVSIPTPILNRARGDNFPNIPSITRSLDVERHDLGLKKRTQATEIQSTSHISQSLRDLRKQTPASRYVVYEGLFNALEKLLEASRSEKPENKCGSKSLFSMCLRAIPGYINKEEALSRVHMEETKTKSAINNRDISTEIYDDLEAFGCTGKGWKHFRTIVRAHGTLLICDAIGTGSLEAEFVGILITLCIYSRATNEAEMLLASLLSRAQFPAPKSVFTRFHDDPETRPLMMLGKYVEITGSFSFQYGQLSSLISSGLLPLGWLATKEFGVIWAKAIQTLSIGSSDTAALLFMDTVLPLLARAGGSAWGNDDNVRGDILMLDAVKQTFSSLLTTLSSIVILSGEANDKDAHTTEYNHFTALIHSCLLEWKLACISNIQGTCLIITYFLVVDIDMECQMLTSDLVEDLLRHLHHMGESSTILPSYHEIVSFICSVARCCGRGASNSGFEYLQKLHQKLEDLAQDRHVRGRNVVREILADSALAFAQEVPDRSSLDYADTMEARVHRTESKPRVSLTPKHSLDSSRTGFRWEEGISEWVIATPFTNTRKCRNAPKVPRAVQTKRESPIQTRVSRTSKLPGRSSEETRLRSSESNTILWTTESSPGSDTPSSALGEDNVNHTPAGSDSSPSYEWDDELVNTANNESLCDQTASSSSEQLSDDDDTNGEPQSSSPQSDYSKVSKHVDFSQSENCLLDESFTSISSADSGLSEEPGSGRRHIDRVPRLSRRVLRRSLQWQLFQDGESDDELSFISASSEDIPKLQAVSDNAGTRRQRPKRSVAKHEHVRSFDHSCLGDSDDELGN